MFSSSSLSVILQNNTIYANPYMGLDMQQMSLRGVVALNSSALLKVKRIFLQFSGKLAMTFPGTLKKTRRNIVDLTITLLEPKKVASISGQHMFPFEILLPNDLPESFRSEYGKIKYTLKAVVETTFISSDLKSEVPVYIQRNIDMMEEPSEEYKLDQTLPNKVACKAALPTAKYTPGEKFDIQISALALDPTVKVTNVTCALKEYTYFHIPSKSDQTRLSVAEYVKRLSTTSTLFNTDENTKTLLMKVPENTSLNCINTLVDVTHDIVVRVDWEKETGEKDCITLNIPIEIVASVNALELDQLPAYHTVELPPSYHVAIRPLDSEATSIPLPPSYDIC
ncbi:hypothetical protein K7432_005210 [Basidiobolus ranarum]|uniref:Arrestin C-terminal-like domain-containing protein n=1 Tax=Basidiobolus ranarum TaxID=34480 RepID=A0ABR2W3U2_9FUNG